MSPDPGSRQGCVGATRVDAAQRLPRRGQEQKENGGRVLAELRTSQRTCKFFVFDLRSFGYALYNDRWWSLT